LQYYIHLRLNYDPGWKQIKVSIRWSWFYFFTS
jgi:5'-3' exonuclease